MATALMIPSCNTPFAKVKLRLKTTQLETIFYSCSVRKLFRGNYWRGNSPKGNFMGGNFPGESYPGGMLQWKLSWWQKPGWQLCLGVKSPGVIVRGGIL